MPVRDLHLVCIHNMSIMTHVCEGCVQFITSSSVDVQACSIAFGIAHCALGLGRTAVM